MPPSLWAPVQVIGTGDQELMRISELQRGTIHRVQLAAAGVKRGWIAHRRATGQLHPLTNDVFLVGRPRAQPLALETAAILQYSGHAVLSHDSAALLWGTGERDESYDVTITLIGRYARSRPGLKIHRVAHLHPHDMTRRRGLPVTSAARMLVDRAAHVDELELENDLAELRRRHPSQVTDAKLTAALARTPSNHGGIALVKALLEANVQPARTRSIYERRLLAVLRESGLPLPLANATVCGHMVDFVWPEERLIVEFDGFSFHSGRRAFETDRERDAKLIAAGYRVIRVTARQLDHHPFRVVARIAAALALAA